MGMLLDLEYLVLLLEHHADVHIKCRGISILRCIICILYITSCPLLVVLRHVCSRIFRIEVLNAEETSTEVDLSMKVTVAVHYLKARNTGKSGHLGVFSTECRRDVNDTGTILAGNIVTRDYLEGTLARVEPRDELLIADTCELRTLHSTLEHLERNELIAWLVVLESDFSCLGIEERAYKSLSHDIKSRLSSVWIERENSYIIDVRSNAERCI